MSTKHATAESSTDPRSRYVPLGTDAQGAHHTYHTRTETVLVVEGSRVVYRQSVDNEAGVDGWVEHITDVRGWSDRRYGTRSMGAWLANVIPDLEGADEVDLGGER